MKIRSGFVSNSSSSSFIIFKADKEKPSEEQINNFVSDDGSFEEDEYLKKRILKIGKDIDGYKLVRVSVEMDAEEDVGNVLRCLGIPYINEEL